MTPTTPMDAGARIPPHDLTQEEALISTCMGDWTDKTYHRVAHIVAPEHFYSQAHRYIWKGIQHAAKLGSIDAVKVAQHLKLTGRLSEIGGLAVITRLTDEVAVISDVEGHAYAIVEMARVRTTIATCQRVAAEGYLARLDHGVWLQDSVLAVTKAAEAPAKSSMEPIDKPIRRVFDRLAEDDRARAEGRSVGGLSTGFHVLDATMGEGMGGELIIVAARPGMGKTSFVMDIAVNAALSPNTDELAGVAIFSLEMPKDQLTRRMLASRAQLNVRDVMTGKVDLMALDRAARVLAQAHICLDDTTTWLDDIIAVARRTKLEMSSERGPHGEPVRLRMVGIDYLQLIKVPVERGRNRDQELGIVTRALKSLAKELDCVVYLLSQLNRSVEDRPDKRPKLRDLRESGNIEQDADRVLFIYRDDYYDPQSSDQNIAEIIIAKNRNGPANKMVPLSFRAECVRFSDLGPDVQLHDPAPMPSRALPAAGRTRSRWAGTRGAAPQDTQDE